MKICVVGLGYVGLPLAAVFSKSYPVIGFDISSKKIDNLKKGLDETNEVENLAQYKIDYTNDAKRIKEADFIIVAVPTPINLEKEPDLSLVESASKIVGENIKKGAIVVYESTVYPGVTEEICVPIIEKSSKLKCGKDFKIGYSPERVNPGDKEHTIEKIVKVVSGMDEESTKIIAETYGKVIKAGIYQAPNIKTAEAAKVIENIQRDLNIALMNELSLIFEKMGINTNEVLKAAGTKWNFQKYSPGLVGGHCIGVDPYYLTYKARQLGYFPQVILAGRDINEYMALHVAEHTKNFLKKHKKLDESTVLIMGLTFKENINDYRNSKVKKIVELLKKEGVKVIGCDPFLKKEEVEHFGIDKVEFDQVKKADAIILAVAHKQFAKYTLKDYKQKMEHPILLDIKNLYSRQEAEKLGFEYYCF